MDDTHEFLDIHMKQKREQETYPKLANIWPVTPAPHNSMPIPSVSCRTICSGRPLPTGAFDGMIVSVPA